MAQFSIPAGFGSIQPNKPPSMLEAFLATRKQRQDEDLLAYNMSRQQEADQFAREDQDRQRAQFDATQAAATAKTEQETFDRDRKQAAALLRSGAATAENMEPFEDVLTRVLGQPPTDASGLDPMMMADALDPPKEYTLGAGGKRMRGEQVIAENPREVTPTPEKYGAAKAAVDAEGNPIFAQVSDRGNSRVVPGIKPPPKAEGRGDVRERKIQDAIQQFGLDRKDAVGIVDGIVDIEIVPETGTARLINKADQSVREVPIGQMNPESEQSLVSEKPGETLYDLAEFATGPGSAVKAGFSVPAAWLNMPVPERTVNARATLIAEQQNLIRSLAINPRFPVSEMERIRKESNLEPGIFDDPKLMRLRMKALDKVMRKRMGDAQADSMDANNPVSTRSAQAQNAIYLEHFLNVLGAPQSDPKGIPKGSKRIGKHRTTGKIVYETPDGKRVTASE